MGLVNPGQQSIGGINGFSYKFGVNWPLNAGGSFDPLNPPGGPPVAAFLASSLALQVGEQTDEWFDTTESYKFNFAGGGGTNTVVRVGGKIRVRCPSSGNVVAACITVPEGDPFTVPTGACSIVLVSAALQNLSGGVVLSDNSSGGAPRSVLAPNGSEEFDTGLTVNDASVSSYVTADTSPHVAIAIKNTRWYYYVDNVDRTIHTSRMGEWGELSIGLLDQEYYPNDDIVAILIFDRELTSQERADYTTWGIAAANNSLVVLTLPSRDGWVEVSDASFPVDGNACTINIWCNPDTDTNQQGIIGYGVNSFNNMRAIYRQGGTWGFTQSGAGWNGGTQLVNDWQMLTITISGSTLKLYYNGQPDGTYNMGGLLNTVLSRLTVGAFPSLEQGFTGHLAAAGVASTALSDAEVASVYAKARADITEFDLYYSQLTSGVISGNGSFTASNPPIPV